MKVILLKEIKNLGRRGDIKEIADGYARNFLLPQRLVQLASPANIQQWAINQAKAVSDLKKQTGRLKELANKIDGLKLEIAVKSNPTGHLFGSINSQQIADCLKAQGYNLDRKQILMERPIKQVGNHVVRVDFGQAIGQKQVALEVKNIE